MLETKTFQNLQVLQATQTTLRDLLGESYNEKIKPFYDILNMVKKANDFTVFDALKKVKEELPMYQQENAPFYFSAAAMEIVDENIQEKLNAV